jgi:hypothetical protein
MNKSLILRIIRIVTNLIESALNGDADSQKKLKDILPSTAYTQLVQEAQDLEDEKKFGPRP